MRQDVFYSQAQITILKEAISEGQQGMEQTEQLSKERQSALLRASIARRNNRPEEAIKIIEEMIGECKKEKDSWEISEITNQDSILQYITQREESGEDISINVSQERPSLSLEVPYYLLAQAYLHSSRPFLATQHYESALKENPHFEPAYRQLGTYYFRSKEYAKAFKVYEQWGKVSPKRGEIWNRLGDIYALHGQHEQASLLFMKALGAGSKGVADRAELTKWEQEAMIFGMK